MTILMTTNQKLLMQYAKWIDTTHPPLIMKTVKKVKTSTLLDVHTIYLSVSEQNETRYFSGKFPAAPIFCVVPPPPTRHGLDSFILKLLQEMPPFICCISAIKHSNSRYNSKKKNK
jgi:hypothetical protein